MKLTVQRIMELIPVVTAIIQRDAPMPQKGKYRFARMHAKLMAEFAPANDRRNAMIKAYDFPQMVPNPNYLDGVPADQPREIPTGEFTLPPDKVEEFNAAWAPIAEEEVEVDIRPIPLAQIDLGDATVGSVSTAEFSILGDLVEE